MVGRFVRASSPMEVLSDECCQPLHALLYIPCLMCVAPYLLFLIYLLSLGLLIETIRGILCNSVFVVGDVRWLPIDYLSDLESNLVLCRSTFFLNIHWCAPPRI